MAKILNDFADLKELKAQLSQEDILPSVKKPFPLPARIRLQGNVDHKTYLDAAVAAIQAYPIILVNYKTIKVISNKVERFIAIESSGHRYFFRFKMPSGKKVFKSVDRIAAFRTIMFLFKEVRQIVPAHLLILESVSNGNFVLSINGISIVSSSYGRFTGTFAMLRVLKEKILKGDYKPASLNEEDALRLGITIRERVQDLTTLIGPDIIPENDYSSFKHEESIRVSTKRGYVEPEKLPKDVKPQKPKVYPGRSLPAAPPKVRPPEPWLVNKWADRYDHDD